VGCWGESENIRSTRAGQQHEHAYAGPVSFRHETARNIFYHSHPRSTVCLPLHPIPSGIVSDLTGIILFIAFLRLDFYFYRKLSFNISTRAKTLNNVLPLQNMSAVTLCSALRTRRPAAVGCRRRWSQPHCPHPHRVNRRVLNNKHPCIHPMNISSSRTPTTFTIEVAHFLPPHQ
jgi:hypothetical protein